MKAKIIMILAVLLSSSVAMAQAKIWTLQQCVDTALVKNRSVKQQILGKKSKEIAYVQARKNRLPDLTGSASHGVNFGRTLDGNNTYQNSTATSQSTNIGLSSSILLFNGFRLKNEIEAKKADVNASEADLENTKVTITTNVAAGYLQILLNKELLHIATEQLELTKTKIEQRQALVASGKMAEGEMLELIAQQSKEELSRIQAENNLKLSLLDLAQYIELDNFENLDVETPDKLSEKDFQLLLADDVYASAITHRPEIKTAEFKLKSNEYNLSIAKSGYYPSLSLNGSLGSSYYVNNSVNSTTGQKLVFDSFGKQLSDKIGAGLSLNLSVPIFDKFTTRNNVRSAQLGIESSKVSIDNAKKELKKSIQQAYYNAISAKSRWGAAQKSVDASQEAYRFSNQKYEAGRATLYELNQAKNNLTQALSEQIQAKYDYLFKVKLLELYK